MFLIASSDMPMLLVGSAMLIGITLPWLFSRRFRRAFAILRQKTPVPGSPTLAILIVTLMGLVLVQIAIIQPGPGAELETIAMILSMVLLGCLIVAGVSSGFRGKTKKNKEND
jgi:drug/metabolite transporter (DMT)-like permease